MDSIQMTNAQVKRPRVSHGQKMSLDGRIPEDEGRHPLLVAVPCPPSSSYRAIRFGLHHCLQRQKEDG